MAPWGGRCGEVGLADGEEVRLEGEDVIVLWRVSAWLVGGIEMGDMGEGTIRYASLRNSSRVSERLRGECLRRALCLLRRSFRRDVRSDIVCYVAERGI